MILQIILLAIVGFVVLIAVLMFIDEVNRAHRLDDLREQRRKRDWETRDRQNQERKKRAALMPQVASGSHSHPRPTNRSCRGCGAALTRLNCPYCGRIADPAVDLIV